MHCKFITTLTVNHVTSPDVQYDSRVISFLSLITLPTTVPFDTAALSPWCSVQSESSVSPCRRCVMRLQNILPLHERKPYRRCVLCFVILKLHQMKIMVALFWSSVVQLQLVFKQGSCNSQYG